MSIRSIAQEGLRASRSFHLFSRTEKNIGDAVETLEELAAYGDSYSRLSRLTQFASSSDPEVKLAQYQDVLEKLSQETAIQTGAEMSGLAGLALLFTERLSGREQARARRSAAHEIARGKPLLHELSRLPGDRGTELLELFQLADPKATRDLATRLFQERKTELESPQLAVLDKYEQAGAELGALIGGAISSHGGLATGYSVLDHTVEADRPKLDAVTLGLIKEHLQTRPELARVDQAYTVAGLAPMERLKALIAAEAEINPETDDMTLTRWAWQRARNTVTEPSTLASELLNGWSRKFPAQSEERAVLDMLKSFCDTDYALDGFLGRGEFPKDFRETALLTRAALERSDRDTILDELKKIVPGFQPFVTSPVQGEMVKIMGDLGDEEAHDVSSVSSAAIYGLQAMEQDLIGFGLSLINYTNRTGDDIRIGNQVFDSLSRLEPGHAPLWKAIEELDQDLALGDQEARRRIHMGILYSMQRGARPDAVNMMKGIYSQSADAQSQIMALRALTEVEAASDPRARLARDMCYQPFENNSSKQYAANELFTQPARFESRLQNLAYGAITAKNRLSGDYMAQRWIGRRALEIGLEEARLRPRPGEVVALEETLSLCRHDVGDLYRQTVVADQFLQIASRSERFGPFQLAEGARTALGHIESEYRDSFARAALVSLERVADRIGDKEHLPKLLEEGRRQLAEEGSSVHDVVVTTLGKVKELDSEAYWLSIDEKDPTQFEFREDEIQIGDVSLEI